MSLPSEKFNAIDNARIFLYELLNPKSTPRVPVSIRKKARALLKHFPPHHDMAIVADRVPELLEGPDRRYDLRDKIIAKDKRKKK